MKALSLWEPWATLIRLGHKRVETRHWSTSYRGPLAICAAQGGLGNAELKAFLEELWVDHGISLHPDDMYNGHAVAVVHMAACIPTEQLHARGFLEREFKDQLPFGNFGPDRYGWIFKGMETLAPFPVNGHQGLFDIPDGGVYKPAHNPIVGEA